VNGRVTDIWRHPIKAHGREALQRVELTAGQTMPWDRHWAVAHEAAKTDGLQWAPCVNFSRGAKTPTLMAINALLDERDGLVRLTHPARPPLTFDPDRDAAEFLDWVRPLMSPDRAASARILRVPGRGMTDTAFPSISLNSRSTLQEISEAAGREVSPLRWRGNIWFDGIPAWAEFDWIGQRLRVGTAELEIREPIGRCLATTVNPETGLRDTDTLDILRENWGHKDFGVYGEVATGGVVAVGDQLEIV